MKFSTALLSLFITLSASACDSETPQFEDGYYLSESGDLIALRYKDGWFTTYTAGQFGVDSGVSTNDIGAGFTNTGISHGVTSSVTNYLTPAGADVRAQVLVVEHGVDVLPDAFSFTPELANVQGDFLLRPISREAAVAHLRKLIPATPPNGTYESSHEEACRGAFDVSCAELYGR